LKKKEGRRKRAVAFVAFGVRVKTTMINAHSFNILILGVRVKNYSNVYLFNNFALAPNVLANRTPYFSYVWGAKAGRF
jgi:hypothetical protein